MSDDLMKDEMERSTSPKLELGKPSDERLELVRLASGQQGSALCVGVLERREEADEQIEQEDAQPVRDDVEALHVVHAQTIQ